MYIFLLDKLRFRFLHRVVLIQWGLWAQWINPVAPIPYDDSIAPLSCSPSLEVAEHARHNQDSIRALPHLLSLAPNSKTATCVGAHLIPSQTAGMPYAELRAQPGTGPTERRPPKFHVLSNWNGF